MDYQSSKLTSTYLRSRKIPSTACSGCGLGMNHKIVVQAIKELDLAVDDIVWGTSIGCAGRQTFGTWKGDGFAGTHGRVYAIARGLRIALPLEKKIRIKGASFLVDGTPIKLKRNSDSYTLTLTGSLPDKTATVIVLELYNPASEIEPIKL